MEEDYFCYICYGEEDERNPFIQKQVCDCKGSIKCHQICLELSRKNDNNCTICNKKYNVDTFLDDNWNCNYNIKSTVKELTRIKIGSKLGFIKHGDYYKLCKNNTNYSILIKGCYEDNLKEGQWEFYSIYNRLVDKINFEKGLYHGKKITYNYLGIIESETDYIKGKKHGIEKITTCIGYQIVNTYENDIPTGIYTKEINPYAFLKGEIINGLYEGKWIICNKEGTIFQDMTYKNGLLNGDMTYYDYKNQITKFVQYKDGLYNGKYKTINENNHIVLDLNLKEGLLHGKCVMYNDEDFLTIKGRFKEGVPIGTHSIFTSITGKTLELINYNSSGLLHGTSTFYNRRGNVSQVLNYRNGILHGKHLINYDEDGSPFIRFSTKEGLIYGKVEYYNQSYRLIEDIYMEGGTIEDLENELGRNIFLYSNTAFYHCEKHFSSVIVQNYINKYNYKDKTCLTCDEEEEDKYRRYDDD